MKLHSVTHVKPRDRGRSQTYCGPAAVSAITGRSAECAAAWINRRRRRPLHHLVKGCGRYDLIGALKSLGYMIDPGTEDWNHSDDAPTLAAWLRNRTPDQMKGVWIITTTRHFVVVSGRKFVDNHTTDPVFIRQSPHRRKRVVRVYRVIPDERPKAKSIRGKRRDPWPDDPFLFAPIPSSTMTVRQAMAALRECDPEARIKITRSRGKTADELLAAAVAKAID